MGGGKGGEGLAEGVGEVSSALGSQKHKAKGAAGLQRRPDVAGATHHNTKREELTPKFRTAGKKKEGVVGGGDGLPHPFPTHVVCGVPCSPGLWCSG